MIKRKIHDGKICEFYSWPMSENKIENVESCHSDRERNLAPKVIMIKKDCDTTKAQKLTNNDKEWVSNTAIRYKFSKYSV